MLGRIEWAMARMKFSEIADRLTGISTLLVGVPWQPTDVEVSAVRRAAFLEDPRRRSSAIGRREAAGQTRMWPSFVLRIMQRRGSAASTVAGIRCFSTSDCHNSPILWGAILLQTARPAHRSARW
jgi:hypothetical protein